MKRERGKGRRQMNGKFRAEHDKGREYENKRTGNYTVFQ
jgi:hypothetical protein